MCLLGSLELEAGAGCEDTLVEMVGAVRARTGQLRSFAGSVLVQQEQSGRQLPLCCAVGGSLVGGPWLGSQALALDGAGVEA